MIACTYLLVRRDPNAVVVVAMPAMKYSTWGPGNAKHGLVFLHGWKMNAFQMRDCIKSLELDAEVRAPKTPFKRRAPLRN